MDFYFLAGWLIYFYSFYHFLIQGAMIKVWDMTSAFVARGNSSSEDGAGVSISFDPQALQEQEEAELAREEQQRQHEVSFNFNIYFLCITCTLFYVTA